MGNALGCLYIGRAIWDNHVLGGDIDSNLSAKIGVEINLFKRRPCKTKTVEQPFMFRTILNHDIGKFVVHVCPDSEGGVFLLFSYFSKYLGLDRASGWESFTHRFSLEADSGFS